MLERALGLEGRGDGGHVIFADLVAQGEVKVHEWAVLGDLGRVGMGEGEEEHGDRK